jgi:hypothetical protein
MNTRARRPFAVVERMDLGDEEHHEHGTLERVREGGEARETLAQRAIDQPMGHEFGASGPVVLLRETPRPRVGAARHEDPMALAKQRDELGRVGGDPRHLVHVGDDREGAAHVVGVGRAVRRIPSFDDDAPGVVQGELGALDEDREVGLEERELADGRGDTDLRGQAHQLIVQ